MKLRYLLAMLLWRRVWLASWCAWSMGSLALGAESHALIPAAARMESVRSIELPHLEPDLPVAPGRDEYLSVCVSCHSPRYVTMQPRFAQRQWEETVDKMAKTYGAQMDPEQRTAIIGYLVATHGPNSSAQGGAGNDEEFDSVPQLTSAPEPTPPLDVPQDQAQFSTEVKRGESLFLRNCAGCHGDSGRGDGVVAAALLRKPKDLASTRFSPQLLSQVFWNGKRGTAMPSWRGLPEGDRVALAAYVQSLHRPAKPPERAAISVRKGSEIFLLNCAPCHGESGDGQGIAAANLLPRPANFKLKQPDSDYLLRVLNEGIPGTAMPAWKELIPEADRQALADFVRSLFQGAGGAATERR